MRVFIISDMEGVAGISKWEQVSGGESLYEEGRKLCARSALRVRGSERMDRVHGIPREGCDAALDARAVTSKAGDWWTAWKQVYL